jgi:hypothetical protein
MIFNAVYTKELKFFSKFVLRIVDLYNNIR